MYSQLNLSIHWTRCDCSRGLEREWIRNSASARWLWGIKTDFQAPCGASCCELLFVGKCEKINFTWSSFTTIFFHSPREPILQNTTIPFIICLNWFKNVSSDTTWESLRDFWRRMLGQSWINRNILKESKGMV